MNVKNLLNRWYDKRHRAPRSLGFTVDEGMPDRGTRYGGAQTLHNTGTVDIMLNESGEVAQVWFRCQMLSFKVSEFTADEVAQGDRLVAVEVVR